MSPRDHIIDEEARELWQALRADSPPESLAAGDLLQVLVSQSPHLDYDRLHSPFLRPSLIGRPPSRS
jgi:hypothetical protein